MAQFNKNNKKHLIYAAFLPNSKKAKGIFNSKNLVLSPYHDYIIRSNLRKNIISKIYSRISFLIECLFACKNNTLIIMRYPYSEIFTALICPLFGKRLIFEHHGKELIGPVFSKSRIRFFSEKIFRQITEINIQKRICVTKDIAIYQSKMKKCETFILPNPVLKNNDLNLNYLKTNNDRKYDMCFVSPIFRPWHGIDLALDLFSFLSKRKFLVIGKIEDKYKNKIPSNVDHIEYVEPENLKFFYSQCNSGAASFAHNKFGYSESASLKTRDYLMHGLKVCLISNDPFLDTILKKHIKKIPLKSSDLDLFLSNVEEYDRLEVHLDYISVCNNYFSDLSFFLNKN